MSNKPAKLQTLFRRLPNPKLNHCYKQCYLTLQMQRYESQFRNNTFSTSWVPDLAMFWRNINNNMKKSKVRSASQRFTGLVLTIDGTFLCFYQVKRLQHTCLCAILSSICYYAVYYTYDQQQRWPQSARMYSHYGWKLCKTKHSTIV